jgi:DNA repair exonuclease SbcCD nuclease subunit
MPKVRFIHTADLHLDTPFKGLRRWNSDLSKKLKDATFKSFKNVIDLCLSKKVDFLIISGDIFDSENKSLAAQLRFVGELKSLSGKGIPTYFTCGNHDPLKSWLDAIDLPEDVSRFDSSGVQCHTFKKGDTAIADIHGISFNEKAIIKNLAADFKLAQVPAPISIAVLHGTIGSPGPHENYAPFSREDVAGKGFDYWALGHIHKKKVISASNPAILYPGNPQGRDFGESGEKGCYLVEISEGHDPVVEFIPSQIIRFENLEIDMSAVGKIESLQGKINEVLEKAENYNENVSYILRINLIGRTSLHKSINDKAEINELVELLNEGQLNQQYFRWIDEVYVNTRSDIDIEKIKNGTGFSAEILKNFDTYFEDDKKLAELIKKTEEDFVNAQVKKEAGDFRDNTEKEMLEKARMILLDKLIKEE